ATDAPTRRPGHAGADPGRRRWDDPQGPSPPSSSSTTSVTVPWPLWKRSVSRKPKTLQIQSAARPASSYASIGMTRCSAMVGLLVFETNDALARARQRGHHVRMAHAVVDVPE